METVRRYGRLAAADTPLRSKLPEERKRETKDKIEARKRQRAKLKPETPYAQN